jgi:hypothetical protein
MSNNNLLAREVWKDLPDQIIVNEHSKELQRKKTENMNKMTNKAKLRSKQSTS